MAKMISSHTISDGPKAGQVTVMRTCALRRARLNIRIVLMLEFAVIGQDFDHTAFGDVHNFIPPSQFEFGLEGRKVRTSMDMQAKVNSPTRLSCRSALWVSPTRTTLSP